MVRELRFWREHQTLSAIGFIAPALLALALLRLAPAVAALANSFYSQSVLAGVAPRFVGLDTYFKLLSSDDFLGSLRVTIIYTAIAVPIDVTIALIMAVLVTGSVPGRGWLRFMMFIPASVPVAVAALLASVAFRPDGPINAVFEVVGLGPQPFLTSTSQALFVIVAVTSWIGIGFWMIFLIAGLHDVPKDYQEAAEVDGAGWWRRFIFIVLPLMKRPIAFVIVADTVAHFLFFAPVQVLTGGGPQLSTNLLMFDVYTNAFTVQNKPTASAEVVVMLVVMIMIVALQFRLLGAGGRD